MGFMAPKIPVAVGLLVVSMTAAGGVVFRETRTLEPTDGGSPVVELLEVSATDETCRLVIQPAGAAGGTPGTWILITLNDAFLVDTARAELAPVQPTDLRPVDESQPRPSRSAEIRDVTLVEEFSRAGDRLLGRNTRQTAWRLRFTEVREGVPVIRHEERHEIWSAAPRAGEDSQAWRQWRLSEDAGAGLPSTDLREAFEQMQAEGLLLRHLVERVIVVEGMTVPRVERLRREMTAIEMREFPPDYFRLPDNYTLTEILAPIDDPAAAEER